MRHALDPRRRTWHITWGTHGTRLHGDERPTVDKQHNERGEAFIAPDPQRRRSEQERMRFPPRRLTREQRLEIERVIPQLCVRGGWTLRVCAAGPDHVHTLVDVDPAVHGEQVRRLLKRWLTQALDKLWPRRDGEQWWAIEGSNRPVTDPDHLNNAHPYIGKQRATEAGAGDGPAR